MSKYPGTLSVLLLLLLWGPAFSGDQTGYRFASEYGEPRFDIDVVDFRTEHEDVNRVEVYYKIFYNALSYKKTDSGYVARYDVSFVIEGDDDTQVEAVSKDGTVILKTYAETRRADDYLINMVSSNYGPQDLKIRAVLSDGEGTVIDQIEMELKKRKYWEKYPTLSRIQFAKGISPADKPTKFNKDTIRVIPSVTRIFGGEIDSMVTFYHEIYPGRSQDENMTLLTELHLRNKGKKFADTISIGRVTEIIRLSRSINVADLPPGDYEIEMQLIGRRGKEYNKLIEEIELELTAESIFQADYDEAVKMLKYLATGEELKKLKKAETFEDRRREWDEFWALRKAGGNDKINPTKLEYFRRIRHSNRYFGILNKDGWKTTRGMVYIKYGAPNEVEDYPFELGVKPYQVWVYYRMNPTRRFTFIDEWGDGNYELQPPYDGIAF